MNKKTKKAQADLINWFFATIIIIIILVVFYFLSIVIAQFKVVSLETTNLDYKNSDLIAMKSFSAYLLTREASGNVYENIKSKENLNDHNGNLAKQIFLFLYPSKELDLSQNYAFGIFVENSDENKVIENDYFVLFNFVEFNKNNRAPFPGTDIFNSDYTIKITYWLSENKEKSIIFKGAVDELK